MDCINLIKKKFKDFKLKSDLTKKWSISCFNRRYMRSAFLHLRFCFFAIRLFAFSLFPFCFGLFAFAVLLWLIRFAWCVKIVRILSINDLKKKHFGLEFLVCHSLICLAIEIDSVTMATIEFCNSLKNILWAWILWVSGQFWLSIIFQ